MPKYRTKDAQLPAGTREGGGVFPLAPTLPFKQQITPVTIVSTIDGDGKQQVFTAGEEGGLEDGFALQDGEVSITNGGSGYTDVIDCSLYDSVLFFLWLNQSLLLVPTNDRMGVAIAMDGQWTAKDGIRITSTGTKLPIVSPVDSAEFIDFNLDDTPLNWVIISTEASNPEAIQPLMIRGLHGLKFRLRFQNNNVMNNGSAVPVKCYVKRIGFKGA